MYSRSLVKKLSDFQSLVYSSSFSTICVTETWLSDYISNYEIVPCNYTLYRKDRNSRGGGVLIAIDNSIPSCCMHSPADLELVCVQVGMSHPFYLCTVYIPPSASLSYFESVLSFFSDILSANTSCILCGDFNFPTNNSML